MEIGKNNVNLNNGGAGGSGGSGEKTVTIALAGNPNAGKTTLFNALTGAHQHVGNWPGVTVEKKEGFFKWRDTRIRVVDLPGTYSLTPYSMEEVIARDFVIKERPDVVVNIVDASNIERNMYLAVQMLELGANSIIALNMVDVAKSRGMEIDVDLLSQLTGAPVVEMVASRGQGVDKLVKAIIRKAGDEPEDVLHVGYGTEIEDEIEKITELAAEYGELMGKYAPRWLAIKLIEKDSVMEREAQRADGGEKLLEAVEKSRKHIEDMIGEDSETEMADRRYGYVSGMMREVVVRKSDDRRTISDQMDTVLANRVLGFPIFFALMWLTFQLTFRLGTPPMEWIELGFSWLAKVFEGVLGQSLAGSLIVDGVIGGVGGVVVFLPNILLLFLAISLLEDTGYMARAAFIMDRVMHSFGLHGKSFIPMLVGIGCSVPAIMATRTLDNQKDRLITMLVVPLVSCGARLPVYILLTGALFSENVAGNVIFSVYIFGIVMAGLMAMIFRKVLFPGPSSPFVMELPPYRMPMAKSVLIHMWQRGWSYLRKAGTIILAISIAMWFLMKFPANYPDRDVMEQELATMQTTLETNTKNAGATELSPELKELEEQITDLENRMGAKRLEYSFAGRFGKLAAPVFRPIGMDWRASLAAMSGFAAKEVVVSTLGTVYSLGDEEAGSDRLRSAIRKDFSPLKAYVFMLFVLLSVPCMATIAIIRKETNSWKWPAFTIGYQFALAWIVSFIVYQLGMLLKIGV